VKRCVRIALLALAVNALVPAASQASLRKQVTLPKGVKTATVRWSYPAGYYVVGTAFEGNTFWAQGPAIKGWRWGYMGGHVHQCVWMRDSNLPNGGAADTNRCGAARSDPQGTPPAGASKVWTSPSGADGKLALIHPSKRACGGQTRRFANADPWNTPVQLQDPMGPVIRHIHPVRARYMTADGAAVLVHDPSLGHTGGYPSNWYFVPTACMDLPS
jgi:hypothetical protein